jgi:hypothetical protein
MLKKIILLGVVGLTGCTGIEHHVSPESNYQVFNSPYSSAGIRSTGSERSFNLSDDFTSAIRTEGLAKDVYYPLRPDDKVDVVLDTKFESSVDTHGGSLALKSFFIGFTMFLFEPLIWYDFDYVLSGEVSIFKNKQLIRKVSAKTDASISAKWLSLSDIKKEQDNMIVKAKKSLFSQLMTEVYKEKIVD